MLEVSHGDMMERIRKEWQNSTRCLVKITLTVFWLLFETGFTTAVLIEQQPEGCGGSFTGMSGNFTSPGYPNKYAENLRCLWNITVDEKSRIHFDFIFVEIEAGDGCLYDYLLFRDGLRPTSPALAKICHDHSTTIKSTGSSASALFVSDSTVGFKGFHLAWRAVPKVPLLLPDGMSITSPWRGMATPKDLIQIDSGITESLWAVDNRSNVYVFIDGNWDLVQGRMASVSAGASVIATSEDGFTWHREGVSFANPKGDRWKQTNVAVPMFRVECGREGVAIGIDLYGNIYQLELQQGKPSGVIWKLLDAIPSDEFVDVSCGSYACWFVTKKGSVYISQDIDASYSFGSKALLRKVPSPSNIRQVAAGFSGALWAISNTGNAYMRTGVNILRPEGTQWQKVDRVSFSMAAAGLMGIYGFAHNGIIVTMEDQKCGGIFTAKKGMFATPNYPGIYPANLTCLWVIKVPDASAVVVQFMKFISIGTTPDCHDDYLVSFENGKYPSKTEPIIECGDTIDNKYFAGNEVWIEFNSGKSGLGSGFQAFYDAWSESDSSKITQGPVLETKTDSVIQSSSTTAGPQVINTTTTPSSTAGVSTNDGTVTHSATAAGSMTQANATLPKEEASSAFVGTNAIDVNTTQAVSVISTDIVRTDQISTKDSDEVKPVINRTASITSSNDEALSTAKISKNMKPKSDSNAAITTDSSVVKSITFDSRDGGTEVSSDKWASTTPSINRMVSTMDGKDTGEQLTTERSTLAATTEADSTVRLTTMGSMLRGIGNSTRNPVTENMDKIMTTDDNKRTKTMSKKDSNEQASTEKETLVIAATENTKRLKTVVSTGGITSLGNSPQVTTTERVSATMTAVGSETLSTMSSKDSKSQASTADSIAVTTTAENTDNITTMSNEDGLTPVATTNRVLTTERVRATMTTVGSETLSTLSSKDSKSQASTADSIAVTTTAENTDSITTMSNEDGLTPVATTNRVPTTEGAGMEMSVESNERAMTVGSQGSNELTSTGYLIPVVTKTDGGSRLSTKGSKKRLVTVTSTQRVPMTNTASSTMMTANDSDRAVTIDSTKRMTSVTTTKRDKTGAFSRQSKAVSITNTTELLKSDSSPVAPKTPSTASTTATIVVVTTAKKIATTTARTAATTTARAAATTKARVAATTKARTAATTTARAAATTKARVAASTVKTTAAATTATKTATSVPTTTATSTTARTAATSADTTARTTATTTAAISTDTAAAITTATKLTTTPADLKIATIKGTAATTATRTSAITVKEAAKASMTTTAKTIATVAAKATVTTTAKVTVATTVKATTTATTEATAATSDTATSTETAKATAEGTARTASTATATTKTSATTTTKAIAATTAKSAVTITTRTAAATTAEATATIAAKVTVKRTAKRPSKATAATKASATMAAEAVATTTAKSAATITTRTAAATTAEATATIATTAIITSTATVKTTINTPVTIPGKVTAATTDTVTSRAGVTTSEATLPSDWEVVDSSKKMSTVAVSINDNVWALDKDGRAYFLLQDKWLPVGSEVYRSLAIGMVSVWAIQKTGYVFYRYGVTEQFPLGHSWIKVDSPLDLVKILISADNDVLAWCNDGSLFVRLGISDDYPFGREWHDTGLNVKDVAVSSYGVFIVNMDNSLSFAEIMSKNETSFVFSKWTQMSETLRNISSGHGSSLWGLQLDGTLLKRVGVKGTFPFGTSWEPVDGKTLSVSPGLYKVYRVLEDGEVVRRRDNVCGGIFSSRSGRITSPNYPNDYFANLNCLWLVQVPDAVQLTVNFHDFSLEDDPLCLNDRIFTFEMDKEPYSECGTNVRNKTIQGKTFMLEFVTNNKFNARGFELTYGSYTQQDLKLLLTTTTTVRSTTGGNKYKTTVAKSEVSDCDVHCSTRFNPVCGTDNKTYANECILRFESCLLRKEIIILHEGECRQMERTSSCNSVCKDEYTPVCGSDGETYANECMMKAESCLRMKSIVKLHDGQCIEKKACDIQCETKYKPVCGSDNRTYANDCMMRREACLQLKDITISYEGECNEKDIFNDWKLVLPHSRISVVAANKQDSLWALDASGRPLVRRDAIWERVGNEVFKSISVGERGVWGIKIDGSIRYRQGMTKLRPEGTIWLVIDGDEFHKIILGPFNRIMGIKKNRELVIRTGISSDFPIGTGWKETGKIIKDASIGDYGVWVVNLMGVLQFAPLIVDDDLSEIVPQWTDVSSDMSAVHAGHGGSLWGIQDNGTLVQREGVTMESPTGTKWKMFHGMTTSVTSSVNTVYRALGSGTVLRREDNKCGGLLLSMKDSFTTPNYPSTYPMNANCLWIIRVPFAMGIKLEFDDFALEESNECRGDRVTVKAPKPFRATRECGSYARGKILTGQIAMVEFVSNGELENRGFKARYHSLFMFEDKITVASTMETKQKQPTTTRATTQTTATTTSFSGCGGFLKEASGSITSPDYPNVYKSNTDCTWVITVPIGQRIKFIVEQMDIENESSCKYDYLRIGDGSVKGTRTRDTICGTRFYDLVSEGNEIWVQFFSDSQIERRGFKASWLIHMISTSEKIMTTAATVPITQITTSPQSPVTTAISGCGGTILQNSGSITSPDYPNIYKSNTDCTWVITVPIGQRIKFTVEQMDIENESSCKYDYLRIGDGSVKGTRTRDTICGTRFYDLVSEGNEIWVQFFSDSQIERRGFKASWLIHMVSTTEKIMTTTATKQLPEGWHLLSAPVLKRFTQIDSGMTDLLIAIDSSGQPYIRANDAWSNILSENLKYVTTGDSGTWGIDSRNHVRYRSSSDRRRWDYTGSEVFRNIDSGPKGFLLGVRSNGVLAYRDGMSTAVPYGLQWVNLGGTFKSVSVGSYGIWGVDNLGDVHFARRPSDLKVFPLSWRLINGPYLTKIDAGFGNNVWGVGSSGQVLKRDGVSHDTPFGTKWISFNDVNVNDITVGFNGIFGLHDGKIIKKDNDQSSICGGILTAESGRILSPGYPLLSYSDTHCLWIIRVPSAQRIRLSVSFFNVFKTPNCLDDYILLYKRGFYSPEYGVEKYCGNEQDIFPSITYNTNEVWLQFNAASRQRVGSYGGFDIRYYASGSQTTPGPSTRVSTTLSLAPSTASIQSTISKAYSGCGGDLSSNFGALTSPGFPQQYQNNLRCIWKISLHPTRELTLKFDQFSVEDDSRCQYDFLLIKTSENGRELGRFCGTRSQPDIIVGGNTAWIYFKTDDSLVKRGFRIIWTSNLKRGVTAPQTQPTTMETKGTTVKQTVPRPTLAPQIPTGWNRVPLNIDIAHVDGGISPNAWAVDVNDNTYVQDGRNWRLADLSQMIWVTSGGSGVWGISKTGQLFYRLGVAPLAPKGIDWEYVVSPSVYRVDSGPMGSLLALDYTGRLYLREGITASNSKGTRWNPVGSGYKHLSVGSYGYWAVSDRNEVFFATMAKTIQFSENLRWTRVGGKFSQIKAGFGSSLWAVTPEGDLYYRAGISAITPRGLRWVKESDVKVNGVTTGMSGVFASVQGTNQLITKPDRICGDIFTATAGSFGTPGYPLNYPSNTTCLWQIKVPGAGRIIVEFDDFQLEEIQSSPASCNRDYLLYLRDGQFPSEFGARKRCGRSSTPIIFEGDKAWIEFVSNDAYNSRGFLARYRAIEEPGRITKATETTAGTTPVTKQPTTFGPEIYKGCGGSIDASTVSSGRFAHPSYPVDYSPSQTCTYVIRTVRGKKISLDFDLFDLEGTSDCRYDSFEIRDGESASDPLIGLYCDKLNLKGIKSTGNALYLRFRSDSSTQFKGYLGRWRSYMDIPSTTKKPDTTTRSGFEGPSIGQIQRSCGGEIDATSQLTGYFAHTNYPNQYSNDANCTFVIKAPPGRKIKIRFEKFALEDHETCRFDRIEVRNIEGSQPIQKFCGKVKPSAITSKGNSMTVQFVSDFATTDEGFLIRWNLEIDNTLPTFKPLTTTAKNDGSPITACGGTFRSDSGLFATPNYPNNYGNNLDCQWNFIVSENKVIELTFEVFKLEQSPSTCNYDFVQIFDVVSNRDIDLGKYCDTMPNEIRSSGEQLKVLFRSDSGSSERGFVARWIAKDVRRSTTPLMSTTKQPCFQNLAGVVGQISEGGESSFYQPYRDCTWLITVGRSNIIKLELQFFSIEDSPFCNKDSLKIYDGPSEVSRTIANLCGEHSNRVFYSSGNQVRIVFKTDGANNARGFNLLWSSQQPLTTRKPTTVTTKLTIPATTAATLKPTTMVKRDVTINICDTTTERVSGESGTITSPSYPSYYPPNQRCSKIIETSPNKRLTISFKDFALEPSIGCQNDRLFIDDGDSTSSYCGYNKPADLETTKNSLTVMFESDISTPALGFRLTWKSETVENMDILPEAPSCGGKLFGSSGMLESPKFSRLYPFTTTCTWVLEVGPSSSIDLQLVAASFYKEDCNSSLLIRDGLSYNSKPINVFCRNATSSSFKSNGNTVYIEHKIEPNAKSQFVLKWFERTDNSFKAFNCGGIKTKSSGSIASPGFPLPYPNDVLCTWMIVAPKGHKISMEFTNFKLEQEADCSKDYLLIRDGSSSVNTAIGRYCGTVIPRKMLSSRNSIWLQLRADCKVPSTGFRMTWKFVKDGAEGTVEPGTLRLSTQMQTTQVPTRLQTTLTQTTRISTRLLTTRETTSETTNTQPETTPTVPNVNARGGLITGQNGVIQSPSYPRPYPNNADITWVLMGPSAGTISITFRAFSLEEDSACRYDYVELRDGPASNSPFIGKFCGRNVPATFMSADNALFVKFKSDVSENQAGFRANWQWVPAGVSPSESKIDRRQTSSACGGVLTRESGEISSPNYPGFYPPNSDCIWVIKPPSGKPVEISFKSFNIEAESRCGYDFVELRDGESRQSRTLGKFCGSSLPHVKTSGKGTLWIRFKSDSSTSDSGFLASWKTINSKRRRREIKTENFNYPECNFALSGNNGKLKMDKDGNLVVKGPGTTCSWTIKTSIDRRITLHIRDLGFKKQSSCVTNHMEIYRVFDNRYELLKFLCPSGEHLQRITIPTRSRRVFVKYITDGKETRRNFKVKWTTTEKKL